VEGGAWTCTTDGRYEVTEGSLAAVVAAVRAGADLRRLSSYQLHGAGLVEETMALQATWVRRPRPPRPLPLGSAA
jgi:hypothetical protein